MSQVAGNTEIEWSAVESLELQRRSRNGWGRRSYRYSGASVPQYRSRVHCKWFILLFSRCNTETLLPSLIEPAEPTTPGNKLRSGLPSISAKSSCNFQICIRMKSDWMHPIHLSRENQSRCAWKKRKNEWFTCSMQRRCVDQSLYQRNQW